MSPPKDDTSQHSIICTRINWFKNQFPHFFTPKVVQNREEGQQKALALSDDPHKENPVFVKRIRYDGETDFVQLKEEEGKIKLISRVALRTWSLSPCELIKTINASTHEWVNLRFGHDTLVMNRAELVEAASRLKLSTKA